MLTNKTIADMMKEAFKTTGKQFFNSKMFGMSTPKLATTRRLKYSTYWRNFHRLRRIKQRKGLTISPNPWDKPVYFPLSYN